MTAGFAVRFNASVTQPQIGSLNAARRVTIAYPHPYPVNQFMMQAPSNQGAGLSFCHKSGHNGVANMLLLTHLQV